MLFFLLNLSSTSIFSTILLFCNYIRYIYVYVLRMYHYLNYLQYHYYCFLKSALNVFKFIKLDLINCFFDLFIKYSFFVSSFNILSCKEKLLKYLRWLLQLNVFIKVLFYLTLVSWIMCWWAFLLCTYIVLLTSFPHKLPDVVLTLSNLSRFALPLMSFTTISILILVFIYKLHYLSRLFKCITIFNNIPLILNIFTTTFVMLYFHHRQNVYNTPLTNSNQIAREFKKCLLNIIEHPTYDIRYVENSFKPLYKYFKEAQVGNCLLSSNKTKHRTISIPALESDKGCIFKHAFNYTSKKEINGSSYNFSTNLWKHDIKIQNTVSFKSNISDKIVSTSNQYLTPSYFAPAEVFSDLPKMLFISNCSPTGHHTYDLLATAYGITGMILYQFFKNGDKILIITSTGKCVLVQLEVALSWFDLCSDNIRLFEAIVNRVDDGSGVSGLHLTPASQDYIIFMRYLKEEGISSDYLLKFLQKTATHSGNDPLQELNQFSLMR